MANRKDWTPRGYLTKDEVSRLLAVIDSKRDKAIFTLAVSKGLRASEIGNIQLMHLRLDDKRIFIPRLKGSVSAEYKLNPDEVRIFKAWIKERGDGPGALFPSNRGTGISRKMVYYLMQKYGEKAKLPVEKCFPHILKHTAGTLALEATRNIMQVKDLLGHKDIRSTLVYVKLTDAVRDETVDKLYEAMKGKG